jgi:ABC-type multidrug transport system permease subunit
MKALLNAYSRRFPFLQYIIGILGFFFAILSIIFVVLIFCSAVA